MPTISSKHVVQKSEEMHCFYTGWFYNQPYLHGLDMNSIALAKPTTKTSVDVTKKAKRERIVIDANRDAVELLDELKERTGSGTRAELLRNMLRFVAAYMDELDEGSKPLWKDKDGEQYTANGIPRMLVLNWKA